MTIYTSIKKLEELQDLKLLDQFHLDSGKINYRKYKLPNNNIIVYKVINDSIIISSENEFNTNYPIDLNPNRQSLLILQKKIKHYVKL